MNSDEINLLEAQVSDLIRKIDQVAKAGHPVDEQDDDTIDASDPSAGYDDNDNGDDDEEDDDDIGKASNTYLQNVHDRNNRPGELHHAAPFPPDPYRVSVASATPEPTRTKFDARVDFIKDRDNCSKSVAMQRARLEYPDDYTAYQKHIASTSTPEQYAARTAAGGWGTNVGKRAPVTAEDFIQREMAKGCSREVAGQRVAQQYGFRAFDRQDAIAKRADDLESALVVAAQDIWKNNPGLDSCEALRQARLENPRLFKAMQKARHG
jgi:hypothetical protein